MSVLYIKEVVDVIVSIADVFLVFAVPECLEAKRKKNLGKYIVVGFVSEKRCQIYSKIPIRAEEICKSEN